MKHTYFMQTERLGFGQWMETDLPLAQALWGNPDVTRLISASGTFSDADVEARLQKEMDNGAKYGVEYWPVFELETGGFAGCCGLRPFDLDNGIYEYGVHLLPTFWGKGLAGEGGKAVIAYAFETLHAKEVYAGHHPDNAASRRALEKLGFEYMFDSFYEPTGLMHPSYRFVH